MVAGILNGRDRRYIKIPADQKVVQFGRGPLYEVYIKKRGAFYQTIVKRQAVQKLYMSDLRLQLPLLVLYDQKL